MMKIPQYSAMVNKTNHRVGTEDTVTPTYKSLRNLWALLNNKRYIRAGDYFYSRVTMIFKGTTKSAGSFCLKKKKIMEANAKGL